MLFVDASFCASYFLPSLPAPMQEGLAHLCLVGGSTTLVRAKIEANLPRKRGPAIAGYDKAWDKFMDQVGLRVCVCVFGGRVFVWCMLLYCVSAVTR